METREDARVGQYMINGEVVELREAHPTPTDLKRAVGSPASDFVMATTPGGQLQKLHDGQPLPAEVDDLVIVPAFEYGC